MKNDQLDVTISKQAKLSSSTMSVPSGVSIAGIVTMNIESEGTVVITKTGLVDGDIRAPEIQIDGKVTGSIQADEVLKIFGNAMITGSIKANHISIEEGAHCNLNFITNRIEYSKKIPGPVSEENTAGFQEKKPSEKQRDKAQKTLGKELSEDDKDWRESFW